MANPFVDPSVLQPANPLQTLSQLNQIQSQRNQLSLFPQVQQQAQIATQAQQLQLNQTNDQAVWQALQGSQSMPEALQRLGQLSAGGGLDVSRATQELAAADPSASVGGLVSNRIKAFQNPHDLVPQFTDQGTVLVPTVQGAATGQPAITKGISPQFVNTGGTVVPTVGGQQTGPGIATTMTPEGASTPTQIGTNPDGSPRYGTRTQFLGATGADPMGTGRPIPPGLRGPNAPPPGVTTGLGPNAQAAAGETGAQSAKDFQTISQQTQQAKGTNALLSNLESDASIYNAGQPGLNAMKSALVRYDPTGLLFDHAAIAAQESAGKIMAQLAQATNPGSDARQEVSIHANPNGDMSPQGMKLVIHQLQGNNDYNQAFGSVAAGYPDTGDVRGLRQQLQPLNPQVFQYQRLEPAERALWYNGLPPAQRQQFQKDYAWASQPHTITATVNGNKVPQQIPAFVPPVGGNNGGQ